MSEWWSYRLSSFLLFSERTYYRLFELYNRDLWPAHVVALAFGVVILVCLFSHAAWRGKAVAAMLGACWLWVAWAYLAERYASINWAASYFAIGFAIEALLLLWAGVVRDDMAGIPARARARTPEYVAGICLFLFALIVQPLIGPMLGRPWLQAEIFGIAPDPTVVATLGILLAAGRRRRWLLMAIPLLWCLISGATLWTMEAQEAWVMPVIGLLAALLAVRKGLSARSE
jgi:hypothetical protein